MNQWSQNEASTNIPRFSRELWLAFSFYLGMSLLMWSKVWLTGNPVNSITCNCGDPASQIWWLAWVPHAIQTGQDPFISHALFARLSAVNSLSNTSSLAVGLILAPLTILFGPAFSGNVSNLLAPVLSAIAAYAFAARFVHRRVSRLVAGLCFGFSPFVLAHIVRGNTNLTLLAYLPLVLIVLDRLRKKTISPRRAGVWLAVISIMQFFIGTEVLLISWIAIVPLAVMFLIVRYAALRSCRQEIIKAGLWFGCIALAVLAVPTWMIVAGPDHVIGPYWLTYPGSFASLVSAPGAHISSISTRVSGYLGPQGPPSQFMGWGLLVVLTLGSIFTRSRTTYLGLAVATVFLLFLESAPRALWSFIPLVNDVVQIRVALAVTLFAGLMLALVVDGVIDSVQRRMRSKSRFEHRAVTTLIILTVLCVALAPVALTYSWPLTIEQTDSPSWYTLDSKSLSTGTAVLVFPFPWAAEDSAMAWQAESGLNFDLVGGFGFVPGSDHQHSELAMPTRIESLLSQVSTASRLLDPSQIRYLRRYLYSWAPLEIVVLPNHSNPLVTSDLVNAIGRPNSSSTTAIVWRITRKTRSTT